MPSDLRAALAARRSYYSLKPESPLSDAALGELIEYAVLNTPSAFNSQSARAVLLLGESHGKLWGIVRETLRKIVDPAKFQPTDDKIRNCFECGRGTVLFYEDTAVIEKLQHDFPPYADAFPGYSENSAGMLQLAVWVMLRDAGMGASLQHYGNLIQDEVAKVWNLSPKWRLVAQMPFGVPASEPGPREQQPIGERVRVFA